MSRCVFCGEPGELGTFIGGRTCEDCLGIIYFRPTRVDKVLSFHGRKTREVSPGVFIAARVVVEKWAGPGALPCALWTLHEGAGETPEEAASRELREETGYKPGTLEKLGGFYAAPGYCTEYLHFFRATELQKSPLMAEDTDEIELVPTSPADVVGLLALGQICDAKTIAGFRIALL